MRIGAYQYSVTGDLLENYASIKRGIEKAEKMDVRLLVFPVLGSGEKGLSESG